MVTKVLKRNIRIIWLSLLVMLFIYYLYQPQFFKKENLVAFLDDYQDYGFVILFLFHIVRGFTMLPPTILIFAGVLLYPNNLGLLFFMTLSGTLISASLNYYFSDKMDFKEWLSTNQKMYDKILNGLESKYGNLFIISWVVFPAVPTDVIGYVAGATHMNFSRYFFSMFIGKVIICSTYIYGGEFILSKILN